MTVFICCRRSDDMPTSSGSALGMSAAVAKLRLARKSKLVSGLVRMSSFAIIIADSPYFFINALSLSQARAM